MIRKIITAVLTLGLLVGATSVVAQTALTDQESMEAIAEIVVNAGYALPTSTTLPPTTTTTAPTTTTTAPTTTTTQPTTTTTQAPQVPAYIDLGMLSKGEGWELTVDDISNPNDLIKWWDANYFFELPYGGDFGWGAGDRCAYRGAYGFLLENANVATIGTQYDLNGGSVIGRAYFASIRDGAGDLYIRLSDGFMIEGSRHFATGALDRNSSVSPEPGFDECPNPSEAYTAYNGPDQDPVIVFYDQEGNVAEVRDYGHTVSPNGIIFRAVDTVGGVNGEVSVTAHDPNNGGLPGVVVYYTALNGGRVEMFFR